MKDLLKYILTNALNIKEPQIEERIEDSFIKLVIVPKKGEEGLIIGKGGKTIKAIRNILKMKAIKEKKGVSVTINEEKTTHS